MLSVRSQDWSILQRYYLNHTMKANETQIHSTSTQEQVLLMRYATLKEQESTAGQVCCFSIYSPVTVYPEGNFSRKYKPISYCLHSNLIFTQQEATPHRDLTIYTWRHSISNWEPPNELILFLIQTSINCSEVQCGDGISVVPRASLWYTRWPWLRTEDEGRENRHVGWDKGIIRIIFAGGAVVQMFKTINYVPYLWKS